MRLSWPPWQRSSRDAELRSKRPSIVTGLAAALALAGFAASAWVSAVKLERLPHIEDEFAYLWQAHVMAEGEIRQPSPQEPASFLVPFVVDYRGARFGKYTPGWPAALAVGARAGAAWLVNPVLAGLGVWLTFRLGVKLSGELVGLLGALLTASSPMVLMLAGSYLSHTFAIVLVLGLTLAWLDLFGDGERAVPVPAWILVAIVGLGTGLLMLTRPLTGVAISATLGLHGLWLVVRRPATRRWLLAIGFLAGSVAVILLLWQWALTGDPLLNPYTLWWPYDRIGFGPGHGVLPGGHTLQQAWFNTRHSLRTALHDALGWPYLSWLFFPFGLWSLRRQPKVWLVASAIPALIVAYAAYWIGAWLLGPRYYVEALPAFAVISAAGLVAVAGWRTPGTRPARRLLVTATIGLLLAINLAGYLPVRLQGLHGLYGIRRERVAPLEQADLGEALVMVRSDHWTDYGNVLILNPPFQVAGMRVALLRGTQADLRLLNQYRDRAHYLFDPDQPLQLLRMVPGSP